MMRCAILAALVVLSACELNDVVIAEPEDMVIAEITLRTDQHVQKAILHRTLNGQDSARAAVPGARIEITDSKGVVITFVPAASDNVCVDNDRTLPHEPFGTCYISDPDVRSSIVPDETYTLRITLADGGVMTGATRVPGDFAVTRPSARECALAPNETFSIEWTRAADAWVYAAETNLRGLSSFFAQQHIDVDDPLRLFGLSASAQDTSILFPTEFGLFQRFDVDLTDVLVQIQRGLPPGIVADMIVAAADRNYVNWERGGDFNPSGAIRIPSIRGAGTGVFGSLVPHSFQIRVGNTSLPACGTAVALRSGHDATSSRH